MNIRPIKNNEIMLLSDFLYEAIFQRDTNNLAPRTIIQDPSLWIYINEFAISTYPQHRGKGIGTALMRKMLEHLQLNGYSKTSLAVQKDNYAVKMYQRVGFEISDENEQEYIMICNLKTYTN